MLGIHEMFAELANWEQDEFDFHFSAETALAAYREHNRERMSQRRKLTIRDKWNNRTWNVRDKQRRAIDPEYREMRRRSTRERMRRLREKRKNEAKLVNG